MTDSPSPDGRLREYLAVRRGRPLHDDADRRVVGVALERVRTAHSLYSARRRLLAASVICSIVILGGLAYSRLRPTSSLHLSALTVIAQPSSSGLECSLPIYSTSADHTRGFIVFSAGRATFRPAQTDNQTYVPALQRWVDTFPQLVSPDGLSYAYNHQSAAQHAEVHVVDSQRDRTILKSDSYMEAFAFTPSGILMLTHPARANSGAPELGLKLLDPAAGRFLPYEHTLPQPKGSGPNGGSSVGYIRSGNALWITNFDGGQNSATIIRYEIDTGKTTVYFDGKSDGFGSVEVVGADATGAPILQLANADLAHTDPARRSGIAVKTFLVASPHKPTTINEGIVGSPGVANNLSPISVTDHETIWFGADDGAIWRYQPVTGLQLMARVKTSTQGAPGLGISGPCR